MKTNILPVVISIILLFINYSSVFAKSPFGTWQTHFSYYDGQQIVIEGDKIYCLASNNLFYMNRSDFDNINENNNYPPFYKLSKLEDLNDIKINQIAYSESNKAFIISYTNGNIDLIKNGKIHNLPFIKNKVLAADKSANDISFKDQFAYLACNFGIVVIDLNKIEIKDTYIIGNEGSFLAVNAVNFHDTYIYAATKDGIKRAMANSNFLVSSKEWKIVDGLTNNNLECVYIESINGTLFSVFKDGNRSLIYTFQNDQWNLLISDWLFKNIDFNGSSYILTFRDKILILNRDLEITKTISNLNIEGLEELPQYQNAKWDKNNNTLWITSKNHAVIKYNIATESTETFQPNGPLTDKTFKIKYINDKLYVLPGGIKGDYNNLGNLAEVYIYNQKNWQNITNLKNADNRTMIDYTNLAISPLNPNSLYVSSWNYGVSQFIESDGQYELANVFDQRNSTLFDIYSDDRQFVRTNGMAFDADGNLWVSNSSSLNGLKVLKPDGNWLSFYHPKMANYQYLDDILVDQNNIVWLRLGRNPSTGGTSNAGLIAIDTKGTIDSTEDDQIRWVGLKDQSSETISTGISSFTFDHDGNLWAGLKTGIAVFYNPEDVFTSSIYASQILIPRNDGTNLADALLDGENVSAIVVDGGNRKWLGTSSNGLLLVSEDGQETLEHFTEENSPLLSNTITSLALDSKNGILYVGTDEGLMSYQTDATEGKTSFSSIHAYPNPARLSQNNTIIIAGLIDETYVKITDANGHLVYETISNGGQARWDAVDLNGNRVSTGVYYIFCSTSDGAFNESTKVLVIR